MFFLRISLFFTLTSYMFSQEPVSNYSNKLPIPIIIVTGSNNIIHIDQNVNYSNTIEFDWDQIPDIGFEKSQIKSIEIIAREEQLYQGLSITAIPNKWRFESDTWSTEYEGRISYLENLSFLSEDDKNNISTYNQIYLDQNLQGYFIDSQTSLFGLYQNTYKSSDNNISKIYFNNLEDQQHQEDKQIDFEDILIAESLEEISIEDTESNTSDSTLIKQNFDNQADDTAPSINTSIDKRNQQKY